MQPIITFEKILIWFLTHGLRVIVILSAALVINHLLKTLTIRLVRQLARGSDIGGRVKLTIDENRLKTLNKVFGSFFSTIIWILAIITMLPEFGVNEAPLLAGLGVSGLALGLASQAIIKDYLAGLFILLEDQYRVGEKVEVAGKRGVVEDFNLRRTVIKDEEGVLCYVPNSQITLVSNISRYPEGTVRKMAEKKVVKK